MRQLITLLFLFFSIYSFAQSSLSKTLDFSVKNIPIHEALIQLSQIAETDIAFSNNFFKHQVPLTADYRNQSLGLILDDILQETSIGYKESAGRVLLYRKKIQQYTVSGYIEDLFSGERLIAATVYCPELQQGTVSNEYGFFSLSLPKGRHELIYSYLGYETHMDTLELTQNRQEKIQLANAIMLSEVIVTPRKDTTMLTQVSDGHYDSINEDLVNISPSLGGEADPIRVAQMLTGVQSGADGLDGIFVRGGDSGHNLMLLDGVTVYIPYHLLGVFSIYNASTIHSAKIYKGSFPARYGGRLSSVFDIRTREGNQHKWKANASVNLISSNALIEGPIKKDKGAVLVAGRLSHSGFLLNPFFQKTYFRTEAEEIHTNFFDYNAKINYKLSPKDRLYLSFYRGKDIMLSSTEEQEDDFEREDEVELNWSNTIFALRWNHLFSDKLFLNTTLTNSVFEYEYTILEETRAAIDETIEDLFFTNTRSSNQDIGLQLDLDYWASAKHQFRMGGGVSLRYFAPELIYFEEDDTEIGDLDDLENLSIKDFDQYIEGVEVEVVEANVYVEDQIQLSPKWQLDIGLRASSFTGEEQRFFKLEPRLFSEYELTPRFTLHTSFSRMVQYLHLVSLSTVRLPNDLWVPSEEDLLPEEAWQAELGMKLQLTTQLNLRLDTYFKKLDNLYTYPDGFTFDVENFNAFLVQGGGAAQGIEFALQQQGKRHGGQFSYAYTRTMRQFEEINQGNPYPSAYDKPHQIKLFVYQKIGKQLDVSLNWVFNSASPIVNIVPLGSEQADFATISNSSDAKNETRLNNYHRLDWNARYRIGNEKFQHIVQVGVYNLYNRRNIAYNRISQDEAGEPSYRPVYALPIRPSFSYRLSF